MTSSSAAPDCCFNLQTLRNPILNSSRFISNCRARFSYRPRNRALSVSTKPVNAIEAPEEKVGKLRLKAAIDFKWIRDNKEAVAVNIKARKSNADLDRVPELYHKYLNLQKEVDHNRAERNLVASKMKGKKELEEAQKLIEQGKMLKEESVSLENDLLRLTDELQIKGQCIPNMTHPDVPIGPEECAVTRKTIGRPGEFSFPIKDHVQLGKELDLIDFDAAAKVYSIEGSDQCLIGTAEIPVGGIHMDSILAESSLALKYVAYSH